MSFLPQLLSHRPRLRGLTVALATTWTLVSTSTLWADCADCRTIALGGDLQLYGKGSCIIKVNGKALDPLTSTESWYPLVAGDFEPSKRKLEEKSYPMGAGTHAEIECILIPQPNEALSLIWTGKTCSCGSVGNFESGEVKELCEVDPLTGDVQCSDPFWEEYTGAELNQTRYIRVFLDSDPRFDPGNATPPGAFPSGGEAEDDEVPVTPDSAEQTFSLGRHLGIPVGRVKFSAPMDGTITRDSFELDLVEGQEAYVEPVVEVGGMPKQFKSDEVLITLSELAGSPSPGVKVEIFSAVGAVEELDGTYTPAGDSLAVHELSRVSTTVGSATVEGVKFAQTKNGVTSTTEHYGAPATGTPGGFEREYQDGQIVEITRTPTYAGMDLTGYTAATTEKHYDGSTTQVTAEKVETFEKLPWGMELTEKVEDPSGAARTSTFAYYDGVASTAPHYGKLHVRHSSDGTWERHVYDANGVLTAVHRPWLTSPTDAAGVIALPAAQCMVIEIKETMNRDGVGSKKETVEKINGRMISKRVTSDTIGLSPLGQQMLETRSETYLGDGTLASVRRTGHEGSGSSSSGYERGRAVYSASPDGSTTLYEHSEDPPEAGEVLPRHMTITTQGTEESPYGIPRQHTRSVTIANSEGVIESSTEVALGGEGNYALFSKRTVERDLTPQIQERTYEDGVLVSTTTKLSSTATETVDEAGLVSQTVSNATTGETEATVQKGLSTMGSYHNGSDLRTDIYKVGLSEFTLTHTGTTRPATPTTSTADSSRTYDKLGRVVASAEKLGSQARTYTYSEDGNGLRSEKEWHAFVTNPVRVRTYYPNGQLKSVTGEAEIGEFYTYEADIATGLQITTVHQGSANSPRWNRTYTDALGRAVREERPAPTGQGTIVVSHFYNAKGQRAKSVNSARPNAPSLFDYNEAGHLFRQGLDLNGNGKLDVLSNEPISEQLTSYEQSGGYWWQVTRSRTYFEDNGSRARENESRVRLGTGPASYSQSIQRPGITTTTSVTLNTSTRTRTTIISRSDSTNVAGSLEINGMQIYAKDFVEAGTILPSNSIQYFYDSQRRVVKMQHPNTTLSPSLIVTTTYDDYGRMYTEKDGTTSLPELGNLINNTYDYYPSSFGLSEGRLYSKKEIPGGGGTGVLPQYTYFAYDARGQQTHTWGLGSYSTMNVYDAYGQRIQLHTYKGSFSGTPAYSAPPAGFTTFPSDVTTWTYDPSTGLQTSKKDAANEEVLHTYNTDGSSHQRTWARGVNSTYTYDDLGRLTGITYSDGTPAVTHSYHRDGTRRTTTDAAGVLTRSLDPTTGAISQEAVTSSGSGANLLSGAVLERSYDAMGRLVGLQARNTGALGPVGALAPGTSITYLTVNGRVGSISSGGHSANYTYSNPKGLPETSISRPSGGGSTDRHHPLLGRRTYTSHGPGWWRESMPDEGGIKINGRNPDTVNSTPLWLYGVTWGGEVGFATRNQQLPLGSRGSLISVGLQGWTSQYQYDGMGNRISSNYGFSSEAERGTVAYTVNALNQYTELTNSRRLFVLGSAQNTAAAKVNGVTAVNQPTADYNVPIRQYTQFAGRLTVPGTDAAWVPVTVEASTASPAVSITQTGNRYHPPAAETMTYDDDGNLTGDGRWVYTWDAENRLIGMSTQTSAVTAGVPDLKLTFAYDAQHRRIRKKTEIYDVPTTSWVTLTDTRFIYDGWNLLVEVETHSGAKDAPAGVSGPFVRRSYVWGTDISGTWQGAGGVSGLLAVRRHERGTKPMATYWTAWDLMGNILGLYNGGTVSAMYEYDPFGRLLRESEPEEDLNPFRFSTKYTDEETGLAYYGYRYYDAVRGRWINRDPIGEEGGLNLSALCRNNAITGFDALGLADYSERLKNSWQVKVTGGRADSSTVKGEAKISFVLPLAWDQANGRTYLDGAQASGEVAWVEGVTSFKRHELRHAEDKWLVWRLGFYMAVKLLETDCITSKKYNELQTAAEFFNTALALGANYISAKRHSDRGDPIMVREDNRGGGGDTLTLFQQAEAAARGHEARLLPTFEDAFNRILRARGELNQKTMDDNKSSAKKWKAEFDKILETKAWDPRLSFPNAPQ